MYRKIIVNMALSCILIYSTTASVAASKEKAIDKHNNTSVHASLLYLQPNSSSLDYAYWVTGVQPYYQSWHSQKITPDNAPMFDVGFYYAFPDSTYGASLDWMHLGATSSGFKQATQNTDFTTLEFVAPPFEMSPPVFGIKRADAKVNFSFDNIEMNFSKIFNYGSRLHTTISAGLDILHVGQTLNTVFSDFAGVTATPYSYALPADPSYSFQLLSKSKYVGAGPDLGLNVEYDLIYGLGLIGQAVGSLTAGTTNTQELFSATSARLTSLGRGNSHQQITTPNQTQVVPGFDGKLGVFYHYKSEKIANITIEGGYRMLSYLNAITTIRPNTLVQPSTVSITPEFATGTMAIVSIVKENSPFNLNGAYVDFKLLF
jgi:hypothetical protein